jgi:nitroreductase
MIYVTRYFLVNNHRAVEQALGVQNYTRKLYDAGYLGQDLSMDAIDALLTRASATRLGEPGPSPELLATAFKAASRAPDHGLLRPWKFVAIQGEGRRRLGNMLADSLKRREPDVPDVALQREYEKAFRAPLAIVVAAKVSPQHKIPEMEQVISAGAATQNMILAFHAGGFASMWRTGPAAYDPEVKTALGLEPHDHIVGIIYVGTSLGLTTEKTRPDPNSFVETWNGAEPRLE